VLSLKWVARVELTSCLYLYLICQTLSQQTAPMSYATYSPFYLNIIIKSRIYFARPSVFDSVITSVFQIIFHAKIHANDIFLFFKNYFWYQHIKTIQNIQIILNFNKKKLKFLKTRFKPRFQTLLQSVKTKKLSKGTSCKSISSSTMYLALALALALARHNNSLDRGWYTEVYIYILK